MMLDKLVDVVVQFVRRQVGESDKLVKYPLGFSKLVEKHA